MAKIIKMVSASYQNIWQSFCAATGIRGFSFLYNSQTRAEKILWSVAILIGAILTITDVVESIRSFSSNPTVTKMRLINEFPFNINEMNLCALYRSKDLKSFGLNISRPTDIKTFLSAFNDSNVTDFVNANLNFIRKSLNNHLAIVDQYDSDGVVDAKFPKLIYLSSVLISSLMRDELFLNPDEKSDLTWGYSPYDKGLEESVEILRYFYLSNNFPMNRLMRIVPAAMWCLMGLQVNHGIRDDMITMHNCAEELVSWFGYVSTGFNIKLCTKIRPEMGVYQNSESFEATAITLKVRNVFVDNYGTDLYLHVGPDIVMHPQMENVVLMTLMEWKWVYIKVLGFYKSQASPKEPCSDQVSTINCFFRAATEFVLQNCGCVPLFSSFLDRKFRNLSCDEVNGTDHTSKVWCGNSKAQVLRTLKTNCQLPCARKVYNFETAVFPTSNITDGTSALVLAVNSYVYPQFEEVSSTSTKQFLAQLGGNLSLWLGASFLVLVHMLVFFIQIPFQPNMTTNRMLIAKSVINSAKKTDKTDNLKLINQLKEEEVLAHLKELIKESLKDISNAK